MRPIWNLISCDPVLFPRIHNNVENRLSLLGSRKCCCYDMSSYGCLAPYPKFLVRESKY